MSSLENVLSAKTSSHSRPSVDKLKGDLIKKRTSSTEETNIRNSLHHLQESIQAINFPYPISFEECRGIDDVIISPSYMEFKDGSEGNVMQQVLNIHNVGQRAALVRVHKPNSMIFEVKVDAEEEHKLYPGLSLNAIVKYTFKQSASLHAMIPIEINGTTLDYHLICTFSTPHLVVEPAALDFGCVNVESVSDVKILTIRNTGGKTGRFSVDVGTSHLINVRPDRGYVKPNEKTLLKVQLAGKYEGVFNASIWIKANPNICISVNVKIIKPKLFIECFTKVNESVLIDFPATYLETRRHQNLVIRNNSSQATSFVILTKDCQNYHSISEVDTTKNPSFDVFQISPSAGRLLPFEETTLNISFYPTFKKLDLMRKLQKDHSIDHFVAVIKIFKLAVAEAKNVLKMDPKNVKKIEQNIPQICGPSQPTNEATPEIVSDEDAAVEGPVDTTLYLHGQIEVPCLQFNPDELYLNDLNIDDRVEQSIWITNPSEHLSLKFAFVAQPWVRCHPDQAFLRPRHSVEVLISIRSQFNLEAVFYLEFDLYASSADERDSSKCSNVSVCRIALKCAYNPLKAPAKVSNHRQICRVASLNKLPAEKDYRLTYTASQSNLRSNHREYWTHYFRAIFSRKRTISSYSSLIEDSLHDEYCLQPNPRYCGDRLIVKVCAPRPSTSRARLQGTIGDRVSRSLTPLQLFKVHVSPLKLDFGKVVKSSRTIRHLTFENRNDFEIIICLISLNESSVTFPNTTIPLIVKPHSSITCDVEFKAENFGKFSSYVNYTINREHKYQLPLLANVVFKNLMLCAKEIVFERDCHPLEGYRLPFKFVEMENQLNADTDFKWILPENSNFSIQPQIGCVPAHKKLYACVYHELDATRSNRIEAALQDEDKACTNLRIEATLRAPNVALIDDSTDLGEIPLNLEHRARTTLYNTEYFGVFFEVDKRSLVKGINVSPDRGSIPPRGIVVLTARFLFGVCVECATQIDIVVQKRLTLQWKIRFTVTFPKIKFEPSVVDWGRVCSNSYRVQRVEATNLTDADIVIRFLLRDYNEFHVSSLDLKSLVPINRGDDCFKIRVKSTARFYVHFLPCDLAHYSIYLPIVINELLGPVKIEDSDSARPSTFLPIDSEDYSNIKGISFTPLPAKLPTINVESTVTHPIVCFNKLVFQFNDERRQDKWRCCNNSEENVTLVLFTRRCTQKINFPFTFCWASGPRPTIDDNGITMCLKPKQDVHFRVVFNPTEAGRFAFELPISLNQQMYNKMILNGLRSKASIETGVLEIILAPVPLDATSKVQFNLRVYDFAEPSLLCSEICASNKCSCAMEIGQLLTINFPRGNVIKAHCSHSVDVEIQFTSTLPVSFRTSINFFDKNKSSSISIDISAAADNSLLSTHAYENQSHKNLLIKKRKIEESQANSIDPDEVRASLENSTNDKQGMNNGNSDFEKLDNLSYCEVASDSFNGSVGNLYQYASIDNTISQDEKSYWQVVAKAIERWLYDEVLCFEFNPTLFDDASLTILKPELWETSSKSDKKKEYPKLCTYIDILVRLANSDEILQFDESTSSLVSAGKSSGVNSALKAQTKAMEFLLEKGALVDHLSVEYLLDYEEYKKLTKNEDYLLDEESFQLRSQHAWIDLLLQSYKVFVMAQVNEDCLASHSLLLNLAKSIDSCPSAIYAIDVADIAKRTKRHCRMHGSEALVLAWLEYNNALYFKTRNIDGFGGKCLNDSLAFIAVTLNYCPYLADFFISMYTDPTADDQKIHNAVCLLTAWKKIRLGFTIMPDQIVEANAIQMLMLSRYLFKYLPTYLIKDKVTFACPLTQSISVPIRLSTNGSHQSSYIVQFIGNDLNAFTCKTIISVYPNKSQQIKVNFFARKILKITAYLVLCGSSIGPHFTKNQVFLLEGFPDELEVSATFSFTTKLYQIVKKTLTIDVPYDDPKEYEIWISGERPSSIDHLAITKPDSMPKHALHRLTLHDRTISIEDGMQTANVALSLACLTCESQSFWIVFRSNLADFIIQIISNYRVSITDNVLIKKISGSCSCPDFPLSINFECPLIHRFLIPSENIQMHNCILKLFKSSLAEEDLDFWTTYLDDKIGLRFVKWIVKNSSCAATHDVFNVKQTYDITTDKNSLLLQQLEHVDDGSGIDQMELMIHICGDELGNVKKTLVTLTCWERKEIRVCQVDFIGDESSSGSLKSLSKK